MTATRAAATAEASTPPQSAGGNEAITFTYEGPACLTAGSLQRWTLRFTANVTLPAGARIAVAHRWPSDWGIAQSGDPAGIDYLHVEASEGGCLRWWSARLPSWHPFDHIIFVDVATGLPPGQCVEMRYGDGRHGSPGFRVQTFLEEASPQRLYWRVADDAPWQQIAFHERRIVGAEPAELVASAPSRVAAGEDFMLHVRLEDRWGNPATHTEPVELEWCCDGDGPYMPLHGPLPQSGWVRYTIALRRPGVQRIRVRTRGAPSLAASSNPIEVCTRVPITRLYWGDLHGQSLIGCGARSIDAYFAHARDFSGTDFSSHQANCFLVSREDWDETQRSTAEHQQPDRFVTLLGVEWSAASPLGGDHNIYFPGDLAELRRCSHEFVVDKSDADTDLRHVDDLYRHYRNTDTLVAVHVGGRTASLEFHDPGLDRLLEVHSTHATSEWFLFDALRRGYRMGVIAGSDGVDGRPGNSHPGHMGVRNLRGGLTAVQAPELTRAALWEALRQRHCYATTGERILLEFNLGAARMGDAINVDLATLMRTAFDLRVEGTAPLEQIDFFRGTQCIRSIDCLAAAGASSNRLRVAWRGASAQGNWERARMRWDGTLRIDGARITGVRGYAFDTPDEGILEHDHERVLWRSVTAGDWDGIVVELDRPHDATLTFVTAPMTLSKRLASPAPQVSRYDAHDPAREVELRWLPEVAAAREYCGRLLDAGARPGEHAYWVRVRQDDGAYAWSSPIFVTTATSSG